MLYLPVSPASSPRSSLGAGSAVLQVQAGGGGAVLRTKDPNAADLSLPLARLDQLQARAEVKELLFGMAAHLAKSGKQQGACSS